MTQNAGDDHDDAVRNGPQDEPQDIVAPDLLLTREARQVTDRALADRFYDRYKHLFVNGDGQLYIYHRDRGAWSRDQAQVQVHAYCMHLSDAYYDELAQVTEQLRQVRAGEGQGDIEELQRRQQGIVKMIQYCEKAGTIGAVTRLVMSKLTAIMADRPQRMNENPEALACANGIIDLRTGTLRHARLEDYITRNTGSSFKRDADFGWWQDTVLRMCGGNPRLAEFIQVWAGYCSTGYTREHCMAILWGMGRNGKNLLIDSIAAALGQYATSLPSSFLEAMGSGRDSMDNNMIYALAQLSGVRMSYVSETGEKGKLRESWVKSLTGDRTVKARLAHQDYFEFTLTHKLVVGTNHKPEITGTDDGVWERIRMVPMRVRFGTQQELDEGIAQDLADPNLLTLTTSQKGREAVLRWVVEGARKYLEHGLRRYTPPEITAETKMYRREQDVLGQFLQDASEWINPKEVTRVQGIETNPNSPAWRGMSLDDRLRVEKLELWRTYCVWCDEHGHHPMSATMFARRITSAQRFWQDDMAGDERIMPPLETTRVAAAQFYRYVRLSENGHRMLVVARSRNTKPSEVRDDE
jgi:putative DNA primase/helicase